MKEHKIGIAYICNGEACGGSICNTECNHTCDVKYALHKDDLSNCLFEPLLDEGGNITAFMEAEKR